MRAVRSQPAAQAQRLVCKTIKLGTCKTPDEYREALKNGGYRIGDWGNDTLGKSSRAQEHTEVDLVVLCVGALGFKAKRSLHQNLRGGPGVK